MRPDLRQILRALITESRGVAADHLLLDSYRLRRDAQAFAALVERHGTMVMGVCRRLLRHEQDAEDAFQATFLVLARRAADVRKSASLSSWLHGVALRVARQARRAATRRFRHEQEAAARRAEAFSLEGGETLEALDEELTSLPEPLRAPLLLCYLAGRTHEQAAGQLGWTLGTLRRRLAQARERLRLRLASRGLAPALLLASTPAAGLSAVPAVLAAHTTRAALGGAVSSTVIHLIEKGLQTMTLTRTTFGLTLVLAFGLGAGLVAYQTLTAQPPPEKTSQSNPLDGEIKGKQPPASGSPFGGQKPGTAAPETRQTGDVESRLAEIEKRLEAALNDVKALRQSMKGGSADPTSFPLKTVSAARAAEVVRAAFPDGQLRITTDNSTNTLFVQASPAEMQAVRRLLDALEAKKDDKGKYELFTPKKEKPGPEQ